MICDNYAIGDTNRVEETCKTDWMESLAAIVATIYAALVLISIANVIVAVLARRGKFKFWIAIAMNTLTGLVAAWGVTATLALGLVPLIGLVIGSIILTWPKKKS